MLNDREIEALCSVVGGPIMLNPFDPKKLQPFGYDLTLSTYFKIPTFNPQRVQVVDPLDIHPEDFKGYEGDFCIVPPNSYILGSSVEYVSMPYDVEGLCQGRSTYVRCGVHVPVTPLEAGWHGIVTIEIYNGNQLPVKVWANKGICQAIFFKGEMPTRTYASKGGQYQGQTGVTLARGL